MGSLAASWQPVRLKHLISEIDEKAGDESMTLLSVSIHRGVLPRADMTDRESRADDFSLYKRVAVGDLVVNRMRAFEGGAGVSTQDGIVSTDYAVLRPGPRLLPRYFHYLVRSHWFVGEMTARLRGIGNVEVGNVRTPRINVDDLGSIEVRLPPARDQQAIAEFLDAETARIDEVVEQVRQQVDRLLERRVAVVNEALGTMLPRVRLKHLAGANLRSLGDDTPADFVFRYVDISSVDSWGRITPSAEMEFGSAPSRARRLASMGDVIISTVRTYLRAIAPVPDHPEDLVFSTGFAVLSPLANVHPSILRWAVQSSEFMDEAIARSVGINYPSINIDELLDIGVRVPPSHVQADIAERLDRSNTNLMHAVQRAEATLTLMSERRRALISAAVTGDIVAGVTA